MKSLTKTFEEILKKYHHDSCNMDGVCNCKKIVNQTVQAVKARDEEVLGEEEEPINVMHPHYERFLDEFEKREELREEIKQRMEETL
jgi:hypothetical protein